MIFLYMTRCQFLQEEVWRYLWIYYCYLIKLYIVLCLITHSHSPFQNLGVRNVIVIPFLFSFFNYFSDSFLKLSPIVKDRTKKINSVKISSDRNTQQHNVSFKLNCGFRRYYWSFYYYLLTLKELSGYFP